MDQGNRDVGHTGGAYEPGLAEAEVEVVDAEVLDPDPHPWLPALARPSGLVRSRWTASPGIQAAAAAATGFVAGAATVALARRIGGVRRVASGVAAAGQGADALRSGSFPLRHGQTYLVHIRVLTPRAPE